MDHYDLEYDTALAIRLEALQRLQQRLEDKEDRKRIEEANGDQHR